MSKVRVRISDNVLEEKHWTIYELDIVNFVAIAQRTINDGVHDHNFLAYTINKLENWSRYDATGQHPEVYHEIYIPVMGGWTSFVTGLINVLDWEDEDQPTEGRKES